MCDRRRKWRRDGKRRGTRTCRNRKRARRTWAEDRETHWINGKGSEINLKEGMIEGEKGRKVEQGREREWGEGRESEKERRQRLWVESNNWLGMLRAAPQGSPADAWVSGPISREGIRGSFACFHPGCHPPNPATPDPATQPWQQLTLLWPTLPPSLPPPCHPLQRAGSAGYQRLLLFERGPTDPLGRTPTTAADAVHVSRLTVIFISAPHRRRLAV